MNLKTFTILGLILLMGALQAYNQNHKKSMTDYESFKSQLMDAQEVENEFPSPILNKLSSTASDFGSPPPLNWTGTFGGSGTDYGHAVVTDESNNIYIAGSFSGKITMGFNVYNTTGRRDALIAKFDNSGTLIWSTVIESVGVEDMVSLYAICFDNSGNVYVTGYYKGAIKAGNDFLPYTDEYQLFYAKLSPYGGIFFSRYYAGIGDFSIGLSIEADANDNVYILGYTGGSSYIHPSIILKYDETGSLQWSKEYDESFIDLSVYNSNLYFTGLIQSGADGYLDDDVSLGMPVSSHDAFIAKADLNCNFEWAIMADHEDGYYGISSGEFIIVDEDENIYMAGYYYDDVTFGTEVMTGSLGFITKCNATGEVLWATDIIYAADGLCIDLTGNLVVLHYNMISKFNDDGVELTTVEMDKYPRDLTINSTGKLHTTGTESGLIYLNQLDNAANELWIIDVEGNSGNGYVIGMVTDNSGNVYTYGGSVYNVEYSGETVNNGIFLCKQNGSGEVQWLKQFAGVPGDYGSQGNYIAIDESNTYIYITGSFSEQLVIPGETTLIPAEGGSIFVLKYDLDGNFIWAIQENFNGQEPTVCPDHSGNLILAGTFTNTISIGNTELTSAGGEDGFIAKYDTNGDFLWAIRAGGETVEYMAIITTDANDKIYLSGEFISENVTVDDHEITILDGDGNIIYAKLGTDGNVYWVKTFGGSNMGDGHSWPTGIETGPDGNIYLKGWHGDSTFFDNIMLSSPYYTYSKFIAKIDPDGDAIWAKSINEHLYGFDYNQFDIDTEGNVYFGAQARDTLHFGEEFMYVPEGIYDLYVTKYTSDGELDWVKTMQGDESSYNWLTSVAVYGTSNVFVGGHIGSYLSIGGEEYITPSRYGFITMLGDDIVGVKEIYNRNDKGLKIFPNPSNGIINLEFKNEFTGEIEIINATGQVIEKYTISSKTIHQIDLGHLNKGIYVVHVVGDNTISSKKIILD